MIDVTSPGMSLRQHTSVVLGDYSYYVRNRVEQTLPCKQLSRTAVLPAMVIDGQGRDVGLDLLEDSFARFEAVDDVFDRDFTVGAILIIRGAAAHTGPFPAPLQHYLDTHGSEILLLPDDHGSASLLPSSSRSSPSSSSFLPEGPYILRGRDLHQAWKLCPDHLSTFVTSIVPADDGHAYTFQPLQAGGAYHGLYPVVAIPSKLYYPWSADKPLNGMRISIKDNFHLEGIVSTLGNRAYTECYGVQPTTARLVRVLIDQGAVIVGKTKMAALAGHEVPPEKAIDYFPPWNPRADGYQGPSCSSSGTGTSVAGYDWLDIALGSDTGGSIRVPAASCGLWCFRATWSERMLEGVMPSVKSFDALGICTRSPEMMHNWLFAADPIKSMRGHRPSRIIYPTDWFPMENASHQRMQEEFLSILEDYTGIRHEKISLSHEWSQTGPKHLRHIPLEEYLFMSNFWLYRYDAFHSYDDFFELYQRKFGKKPYISPAMLPRCQDGMTITKAERDLGYEQWATVRAWITKQILVADKNGNDGPIMLVPLAQNVPDYRDVVVPDIGLGPSTAYNPIAFSPGLEMPQLVVPIGQIPFPSRITGNVEYLPVVGSLLGVKDSEAMLLQVAHGAMRKANWLTAVSTGPTCFPIGMNSRNCVDATTAMSSGVDSAVEPVGSVVVA